MQLTKLISGKYVSDINTCQLDENYISGPIIEKLAKLENMVEELNIKNKKLSSEIEKLRIDGMSKTYQFREYMGMKLTNSRVLSMLEEYKII